MLVDTLRPPLAIAINVCPGANGVDNGRVLPIANTPNVRYNTTPVHRPCLTPARRRPGPASMLAKLNTFTLLGIEAIPVEAEVDASAGLPKIILVGLPELAVKESIHRIERALANLGYQRHAGRLVINLAPGDLRK